MLSQLFSARDATYIILTRGNEHRLDDELLHESRPIVTNPGERCSECLFDRVSADCWTMWA